MRLSAANFPALYLYVFTRRRSVVLPLAAALHVPHEAELLERARREVHEVVARVLGVARAPRVLVVAVVEARYQNNPYRLTCACSWLVPC